MKVKTIIALILAILIVIFSLQNAQITEVEFLVWSISVSRVLVILGSFSFGVLAGMLVSIRLRGKSSNSPKKKETKMDPILESENGGGTERII